MADSRIRTLADEVLANQIQALLDTLYLAVDDTSFTDAKKMLLKTILTETVVSSNTNNFQAMTPKAFYESVMTDVRLGIARFATDVEVTFAEGNGVLKTVHQALMKHKWRQDWFMSNGTPNIYSSTDYPLVAGGAFVCNVTWKGNLVAGQSLILTPELPAGVKISGVYYSLMFSNGPYQSGGYTARIQAADDNRVQSLLTYPVYLYIAANGTNFGIISMEGINGARISATLHVNLV